MGTLIEIGEDMQALHALLEDIGESTGGEIDQAVGDILDAFFNEVRDDLEKKLDGYVALITEWTARAAVRKKEMERLATRVCVDEHNARRLKDRLTMFMRETGTKKIETARYSIGLCNNGGRPPLRLPDDPKTLPSACQKVTVTADMDAIHALISIGQEVPGVEVLPRGSHLRIK